MVLAYVLWGLGLLTILAISLLPIGSASYRLAHLIVEEAQIEAQTAGVINTAVLGLLDPRPERRWWADGAIHEVQFDKAKARVRLNDEIGRIDINQADGFLLAAMFRSVGVESDAAHALAEQIVYWRDPRALLSNEASAAALDIGTATARRAPFQSVDELLLVPGMSNSIFERVLPAITVYSGKRSIDPRLASRAALEALRAIDPEGIRALEQSRSANSGDHGDILAGDGRAFRIRADVAIMGQVRAVEVVVRLTGDPARPVWVLDWQNRKSASQTR